MIDFLKAYNKKPYFLYMRISHIVFTFFCFLVDETNQIQRFSLLLWNYLLILKFLPVTPFKDPKAAILTLTTLKGSR